MEYRGIVAGGSAKANALGYPTANIPLADNVSGIYAARVVVEGSTYAAVAFADPQRHVLEAHLFDFSGNLYGKEIAITLVEKIRDTELFTDDAALRRAMASDAQKARALLF